MKIQDKQQGVRELRSEIQRLKEELSDARETIDAIRRGDVDAIIVDKGEGEMVYSLENAETPYRVLIESMTEGAVVINPDGVILYHNSQFAKLILRDQESLIGTTLLNLVDPASKEKYIFLCREAVAGECKGIFDFFNNQQVVRLEFSFSPLPGNVPGKLCILVTDVTILLNTIEKLETGNDRLSMIIDSTLSGTWEWNIGTGELQVNERWAEILGYSRDELTPISIGKARLLCHPEDVRCAQNNLFRHLAGGISHCDFEIRMQHKAGNWVWVLIQGRVCKLDQGGKPLMMSGIQRDITRKKNTELQLVKSEATLKKINHIAKIGQWEWDPGTNTFSWSDEVFRIFDIEPEDFTGDFSQLLESRIHPDDRELVRQSAQIAKETGKGQTIEYRIVLPSGEIRWIRAIGTLVFKGGNLERMYGSNQDITDSRTLYEKLDKSEKFYHSLFENLNGFCYCEVIYVEGIPVDYKFLLANNFFEKETGLGNVIGKQVSELLPDFLLVDRELFEHFAKVASTGIPEYFELFVVSFNEWYAINAYSPEPGYFVASFTRISEKKELEIRQKQLLSRLQKIASQVPGMVYQFRLRPDGTFSFPYASEAIKNIYRVAPEDVMKDAKPVFDVLHPDDHDVVIEKIMESAAKLTHWQQEYRVRFPDNTVRILYGNAVPEMEPDGSVLWHGYISDITTIVAERENKAELESRLLKINNIVTGVICQFRLEPNGRTSFPFAADSIKDLYGFTPEVLKNDASVIFDLIHPDDSAHFIQSIEVSARTLEPWKEEYRLKFKSGEIKWIYGHALPQLEMDGSVIWNGIVTDISENKKLASALAESEKQFQTLFQNHNAIMLLIDPETGLILNANKSASEFYGFSHTELCTMKIAEINIENEEKLIEKRLKALRQESNYYIFRHKSKDGQIRIVEVHSSPVKVSGKSVLFSIIHDITEKFEQDEKIKELYRDFVSFLENTTDFVYFKDINSRFRFCSQTLARITNHKSWNDMIGKHDSEVFPKDMADIYMEEELPIFREGNQLINKIDPYLDELNNTRWVTTNKWPVFDENHHVIGLFGISRDITEQKHYQDQLKKYASDLKNSNIELEQFAYAASHDLQEPLRMVISFLNLLEERLISKLDETDKQFISFATDGAERMKKLIQNLLDYSRLGGYKNQFESVNADLIIKEVLQTFKKEIENASARIVVKPLPTITGIKSLLYSLFKNLVSNALKYRSTNKLEIEIGYVKEPAHHLFYVKDNGIGIDPKYFNQIFIIFRRLHTTAEYPGTGIGLAICKRIADLHHGDIWVESAPGAGSVFYFRIPDNLQSDE